MRTTVTALYLVAALCTLAAANPSGGDWAYVSFDPNGDMNQNELTVAPYSTVDGYIIGHFMELGGNGWTTISFRLNNVLAEYPGVVATQAFTNLLPGNLAIGDPFDATGVTIASTECLLDSQPIAIGYASYLYLGGSYTISILDHGDYPRWVVDCQDPGQVFYYDAVGEGYVNGGSPVEDVSWGAIKSMYR
mgnify:CR=1 FL=1